MFARTKRLAAATALSGTLLMGLTPAAGAQPVEQDGLVNVNVGDVTIQDAVDLTAAVNAAVQACGIDVGPLALAVLGQAVAVDRSGRTRTICTVDQTGDAVTISNNVVD
jgi:hypothetical protein